ncbi:MAG: ribonuclease Z [Candidatus Nitrosocaldus sp.]|nr:ribonuclease Z [Candidatus Nitrosocaldus sp.]
MAWIGKRGGRGRRRGARRVVRAYPAYRGHAMLLRIIFLGTSSAVPTARRGLTSIAVQRGSELLIFDAGEGMQRNFLQSGLGVNRSTRVFITHMHSDHVLGLLGFMQTLALNGRDMPLHIYGPEILREYMDVNTRLLNVNLTYDVHFKAVGEGVVMEEREYTVKACRAEHTIHSYSYVIEEHDRPGTFYPERALELGVPKGRLWHRLQHGEDVLIDGRVVRSSDVTGPKRRGRRIGISGDTRANSRLEEFFRGCDLLIFDSTFSDDEKGRAVETMHSTAREAAELAARAGVKTLVLTHFSARYDDVSMLVKEASMVHNHVIAAEDMMVIDVPYPSD